MPRGKYISLYMYEVGVSNNYMYVNGVELCVAYNFLPHLAASHGTKIMVLWLKSTLQ